MAFRSSKTFLLWLLVFSQFAGTSVWFVGNAVVDALPGVQPGSYALLTTLVQAGFIAGTLVFAVTALADRISSTALFFFSSLAAAAANLALVFTAGSFEAVVLLRFLTGFFLAGIYPVGMKIAAEVFPEKLGKALGFLVGALVLGTAFPHLVRSQGSTASWRTVVLAASLLAAAGGLLVRFFFPAQKPTLHSQPVRFAAGFHCFGHAGFRSAALGYFGHMWELYAFWALLPLLFSGYNFSRGASLPVYGWSFAVIASGALGCALGGLVSRRWGSKRVAFYSLLLSGSCCVLAPVFFRFGETVFTAFCLFWGFAVTADSPQFSALVARYAEPKIKGTALTLVTCIGFSVTVVSIQLLKPLFAQWGVYSLWVLALGPAAGLLSLKRPT